MVSLINFLNSVEILYEFVLYHFEFIKCSTLAVKDALILEMVVFARLAVFIIFSFINFEF